MAVFVTLASGSSGNSALFSAAGTHILVDAGISFRRLREELRRFDVRAEDLSAIFVTHEHVDHTRGLRQLLSASRAPLYLTRGTACRLELPPCAEPRYVSAGDKVKVGRAEVEIVPTPHDTAESIGLKIEVCGHRLAYFTDVGEVTPEISAATRGAECVFIEANHDVERLMCGRYPAFLKRRILGPRGHLSNEDCARAVCEAAASGTRRFTLCHLSAENNTPALAACAVLDALAREGHGGARVCVAPPDRACEPYIFEC